MSIRTILTLPISMIWLPVAQVLASPLAKIPLLLTATHLTALATTPPTPPPSSEETKAYQEVNDPIKPFIPRSGYILRQGLYYANVICESAVILAEHYPSVIPDVVRLYLIRESLRVSDNIRITPWWLAGCLAMAAGGIIRLACYRTLGRFFTWELSLKKGHRLVTSGPYSIVRHPSYVGSSLIGVGVVLCHFAPGSWYSECVGWETWTSRVFTALWGAWSLAIPALLVARTPTEDDIRLIPYVY